MEDLRTEEQRKGEEREEKEGVRKKESQDWDSLTRESMMTGSEEER